MLRIERLNAPTLVAVLITLYSFGPATAENVPASHDLATDPEQPVTLTFDGATGHIVIPVLLNGQDPRWFILDTGNQQTIMYERVARELELVTKPKGEMGGAGTGTVTVNQGGPVTVSLGDERTAFIEPTVLVLPDSASLSNFGGKRIDGFLGATCIERFVIDIDYKKQLLTLHDPETYTAPKGSKIMAMPLAFGFPYFEGSVTVMAHGQECAPIEGNYLLDLGASYGIALDYEPAHKAGLFEGDDPERTTDMEARGIDGVPFQILSSPAGRIMMGGVELTQDRIQMPDRPGGGPPIDNLVGNVGSGAFRDVILTLDYANERAILTPRK